MLIIYELDPQLFLTFTADSPNIGAVTNLSPTVIWAIVGLLLVIAEVVTATFVLLFFGVAALVVALAKLIGLDHLPSEILVFALAGLAFTFLFRKKLLANFRSPGADKLSTDGKSITASENIAAKAAGSVIYQGTTWMAVNDGDIDIVAGDTIKIVRTDGIKLILSK